MRWSNLNVYSFFELSWHMYRYDTWKIKVLHFRITCSTRFEYFSWLSFRDFSCRGQHISQTCVIKFLLKFVANTSMDWRLSRVLTNSSTLLTCAAWLGPTYGVPPEIPDASGRDGKVANSRNQTNRNPWPRGAPALPRFRVRNIPTVRRDTLRHTIRHVHSRRRLSRFATHPAEDSLGWSATRFYSRPSRLDSENYISSEITRWWSRARARARFIIINFISNVWINSTKCLINIS